jgi:dolichol-phosphate mannosyltransferase
VGADSATAGDERRPFASVVLATLNERGNLPELLDRIRRQTLPPFEVIVVDDGSTDGTREYLAELAAHDPRIRPIFHDGRQTTLTAQRQGIEAAHGESVVVMDADLQHPPERIPEMLREIGSGADLVVASRYAAGGTPGPRTIFRTTISRGAEAITRLVLPEARGVSDPVSGYFAFRREIFVPLDPRYRGYKLLLFVLAMNRGRPVAEVGFRFEPRTRGASKVTQTFAFVRVFLVELVLAQRLSRALRTSPPRGSPRPDPTK